MARRAQLPSFRMALAHTPPAPRKLPLLLDFCLSLLFIGVHYKGGPPLQPHGASCAAVRASWAPPAPRPVSLTLGQLGPSLLPSKTSGCTCLASCLPSGLRGKQGPWEHKLLLGGAAVV